MYALVDCNNFYASCERVFNPRLRDRPVAVLSNNDGCVIARSAECKALGIPMGAPFHEVRHLAASLGVQFFSSNYVLYGDMSRRVMQTLAQHAPSLEVYSIDEAFLDLRGMPDAEDFARRLRTTVLRWTGIPVSIGIGASKTLAKAANRIAKRDPAREGVVHLSFPALEEAALRDLAVEDVWGVGRRWSERLRRLGLDSALRLRQADAEDIRRRFGLVLARTVLELRGIPCLALDAVETPHKSIVVSRSFGRRLSTLAELSEAVAQYASRAAERLRTHRLAASAINVFAHTSPFAREEPLQHDSTTSTLERPTQDSSLLLRHALEGLRRIHRPGCRYQKAGVMLLGFSPAMHRQASLIDPAGDRREERSRLLMGALDAVNNRFGQDSLRHAAMGFDHRRWRPRAEHLSRGYTTRWHELPLAGAGFSLSGNRQMISPRHGEVSLPCPTALSARRSRQWHRQEQDFPVSLAPADDPE